MILFLEGALLGLAITIPVGPINLLCMRRSLSHGRRIGLWTGLGAATGDSFYGGVAAFGLTAISNVFIDYQTYFQLIGGVVFLAMGWKTIRTHTTAASQVADHVKTLTRTTAFISTCILTLTNPATILAFLTAFASLKLVVSSESFSEPALLTFGVFAGSALWWTILSYASSAMAEKFTPKTINHINKFAGVLLLVFGTFLIFSAVQSE